MPPKTTKYRTTQLSQNVKIRKGASTLFCVCVNIFFAFLAIFAFLDPYATHNFSFENSQVLKCNVPEMSSAMGKSTRGKGKCAMGKCLVCRVQLTESNANLTADCCLSCAAGLEYGTGRSVWNKPMFTKEEADEKCLRWNYILAKYLNGINKAKHDMAELREKHKCPWGYRILDVDEYEGTVELFLFYEPIVNLDSKYQIDYKGVNSAGGCIVDTLSDDYLDFAERYQAKAIEIEEQNKKRAREVITIDDLDDEDDIALFGKPSVDSDDDDSDADTVIIISDNEDEEEEPRNKRCRYAVDTM